MEEKKNLKNTYSGIKKKKQRATKIQSVKSIRSMDLNDA